MLRARPHGTASPDLRVSEKSPCVVQAEMPALKAREALWAVPLQLAADANRAVASRSTWPASDRAVQEASSGRRETEASQTRGGRLEPLADARGERAERLRAEAASE